MEICNLPTELLREIVSLLDDASLVQLSLTCKRLNSISLDFFFQTNDIQTSNNWLVAYQPPPHTLSALRAAIWLKKFSLIYFFFNEGINELVAEVTDLYWLIKRLRSVDVVTLHFFPFNWQEGSNLPVLNRRHWFEVFTRLLDVIIERGCKRLSIAGRGVLETTYQTPQVSTQGATKNLLRQFFSMVHPTSQKTRSPVIQSRLTHFSLYSDFFRPTFFDWTVQTISSNSSSIIKLSLSCHDLPAKAWSAPLSSLKLPRLEEFEISTNGSEGVAVADLQDFFARHPTIHKLLLEDVELLPGQTKISQPILPNLVCVTAPSAWIRTLFDMPHSSHGMLSRLESIGISTDLDPTSNHHLDTALSRVAKIRDRQVTLTLLIKYIVGAPDWFSTHVALGKKNSILSGLDCVSTLVISTRYFDITIVPPRSDLLEWFSLFPCLEHVKFVDVEEKYRLWLEKPEFLKDVVEKCPKVKSVKVPSIREMID